MVTRRKTSARRKKKAATRKSKGKPWFDKDQWRYIWALFFIILAALMGLSLGNNLGFVGPYLSGVFEQIFGVARFTVPMVLGLIGIAFILDKKIIMNSGRMLGIGFAIAGFLGMVQLVSFWNTDPQMAFEQYSLGGGSWGAAVALFPHLFLGRMGAFVILFGMTCVGFVMTFSIPLLLAALQQIQTLMRWMVRFFRTQKETKSKAPISKKDVTKIVKSELEVIGAEKIDKNLDFTKQTLKAITPKTKPTLTLTPTHR